MLEELISGRVSFSGPARGAKLVAGLCLAAAAQTAWSETTSTAGQTTSTATTVAAANYTTASTPPLHLGRLAPIREAEQIARAMDAFTTVPGTDLRLGYCLCPPAGWYQLEASTLVWHSPAPADTHQLVVSVQDAADLRVIPSARVTASFSDPAGKAIGTTQTLNFLWDPKFYQYSVNVALPEDAKVLDLHLRVEPPSIRRHDEVLGAFFSQPVSHTFRGIKVPAPEKPQPKPGVPTTRGLFSEGRRPYAEPTPYPGAGANSRTPNTPNK